MAAQEEKQREQQEKQQEEKQEEQQEEQQEEEQEKQQDNIRENGQVELTEHATKDRIYLISIIGEVEGHDVLPSTSKSTKYEHILPKLAEIEDSEAYDGVLVLLNTMGGDVESGLAISEMLASVSKPTVSLVLGGSHSIGIPLAVSTDYSFIVPTGTMVVHPVRMNGQFINASQTYEYFQKIQERIIQFIALHSRADKKRIEEMMNNTRMMTKDLGTILVGEEAVREGIINEVGGIHQALAKLHKMIQGQEM